MTCENGCKNFLFIGTHSKNCHSIKFQNGYEFEGYFPPLHNLSSPYTNDDANFNICVDCGRLKNFNKDKLKESIENFLKTQPPQNNDN